MKINNFHTRTTSISCDLNVEDCTNQWNESNKWINQMQNAIYHCQYDFISCKKNNVKHREQQSGKLNTKCLSIFIHSFVRSLPLAGPEFVWIIIYNLHEIPFTWRHLVCSTWSQKMKWNYVYAFVRVCVCMCQCLFDWNRAFSVISRCVIVYTHNRTCLSYVKEWDAYLS